MTAAPDPVQPVLPSDSDLVRAARGLPVSRTPVWFMRQAGRSLPEYRALRAGTAMLAACQDPDLVTEITLQPVRRHGVDAAILFSDIVLPLVVAGLDIEIKPGVGPVVAQPVRSVADVDALPLLEPERLDFLTTAVRQLVAELGPTPADRVRRRAVHAGHLPDRGRPVEGARAHQGVHVRRAGGVVAPAGPAGRVGGHLPAGPDRRRRLRGAAVRLVGRGAVGRRLRRRGCCRTRARCSTGSAPATSRGSTSASAPVSCCR